MTASEADFLLARPKWWSERRKGQCKEWRNAFIPPAKVSRCSNGGVKERVAGCWLSLGGLLLITGN